MWGNFDYSSQELRLLVHYGASLQMIRGTMLFDEVVEEHKKRAMPFHQMVADMADITRKAGQDGKSWHHVRYGQEGKLANTMDITPDQATNLLKKYHEKVPFVKGLADKVSERAEKNGQIRTILGRLCRFSVGATQVWLQ